MVPESIHILALEEDLIRVLDTVTAWLDHLRGPTVPPSPRMMRIEQYLTQAEGFLRQALNVTREE